jgi:hypothetical protein
MPKRNFAAAVAALMLTGCASIIKGGGPEHFVVRSQPAGASVRITDVSTGVDIASGTTPYTAMLKKSRGFFRGAKYKVSLAMPGYVPAEALIDTTVSGWYVAGNLVFGGLLGWLIVDPATGAMWTLSSDALDVPLSPAATPEKMPASTPTSSLDGPYIGVIDVASVPPTAHARMVRVN